MKEINYLPPAEKSNQEIQLDFAGRIGIEHQRFFIRILKGQFSRWTAASICETPTGKTAKTLWDNTLH